MDMVDNCYTDYGVDLVKEGKINMEVIDRVRQKNSKGKIIDLVYSKILMYQGSKLTLKNMLKMHVF